MAFQKPTPRTPARIRKIQITLTDIPAVLASPDTNGRAAEQSITYAFQVLDANGDRITLPVDAGNLEPHLTAQQVNQIKTFMANIRAKIEAEILS